MCGQMARWLWLVKALPAGPNSCNVYVRTAMMAFSLLSHTWLPPDNIRASVAPTCSVALHKPYKGFCKRLVGNMHKIKGDHQWQHYPTLVSRQSVNMSPPLIRSYSS